LSEVVLLKEDCLAPSRFEGLMLLRYVPHKTLSARRKRGIGDTCEMLIPAFLSREITRQIKRTQSLQEEYGEPYIFIVKNGSQRPSLPCGDGFCDAVNRLIAKHCITDENDHLGSRPQGRSEETIAVICRKRSIHYGACHAEPSLTQNLNEDYAGSKRSAAEKNTPFLGKN
jgi:hypothetical protein